MSGEYNPWDVKFSRTSFLIGVLSRHDNVTDLTRERDILFKFRRKVQGDQIALLGADEYVFSLALVHRSLEEFGALNIISVGGVWNGYSEQAKDYCLENKIGLYNSSELSGGLWKDAYWDYFKKDKDGNRVSAIKA